MTWDGLRRLGSHVAAQEDDVLDNAEPSEATRQHLAAHIEKHEGFPGTRRSGVLGRRPHGSGYVYAALAAAAVLSGVGIILSGALSATPPLSFTVGSVQADGAARSGMLHAWESAPADADLPIRFSDGTSLSLAPNTRARVVAVEPDGAEVVIEAGQARVDVVPRRHGHWRLRTGPFVTEVKGTRFDVSWDPAADKFTLELFEGQVVVVGCGIDEGHTIRAGQRVLAACQRQQFAISGVDAETSPRGVEPGRVTSELGIGSVPAAAPSTHAKQPSSVADRSGQLTRQGSANPASGRKASEHEASEHEASEHSASSWQALARDGQFQQAYALAEHAYERECGQAPAGDLLLLGDAARLTGHDSAARRGYEAARHRFPSSDVAAQAAYALGLLEVQSNPAAAAEWFETYLAERPTGPLAQAAFDRLLEGALALGDQGRARRLAAAYLKRYPAGAHAADARHLLESPAAAQAR